MKRTVFLLCERCDNIFFSSNKVTDNKNLVCGQGCGGELKIITKAEATEYFLEKKENERQI